MPTSILWNGDDNVPPDNTRDTNHTPGNPAPETVEEEED